MKRPEWMYTKDRMCASCQYYKYDPDRKDEAGDGWCTNAGRAKYYTVGVKRLKEEGRDRTTWRGRCFHYDQAAQMSIEDLEALE